MSLVSAMRQGGFKRSGHESDDSIYPPEDHMKVK
jgi:hypothetical protein